MKLKRRNWNERNYKALNKLLAGVRPAEIAVFDWDNTCIFGDVGEALLRRMVFDLAFAMNAKAMAATLPNAIHGVSKILLHGKPYPLKKMKNAVFCAYENLKREPSPRGKNNMDESYRIFTSGLLALNRALEETPGIGCEFAYPWVNLLLQGLPLAEFDRLAGMAVGEELRNPIRRRALVDPRRCWRYGWTSGIRVYQEMWDLAACWQERGGEVVVSSASNRRLVEKTISMTGFPCREVIGMELAMAGNRFGDTLKPGLRPNLGPGKVTNIRNRIDSEPALVAGDSSNDFEMLTSFRSTRLRLVVDRCKKERSPASPAGPGAGKTAISHRKSTGNGENSSERAAVVIFFKTLVILFHLHRMDSCATSCWSSWSSLSSCLYCISARAGRPNPIEESAAMLDKTRVALLPSQLQQVEDAIDAYADARGARPADLAELVPGYLRNAAILIDPWGTQLRLERSGEMSTILISAGPDHVFATRDDIRRSLQ